MQMKNKGFSKYGSQKVERDGLVFDSQKEYRRWFELKLLQQMGNISELQRQVSYELIPSLYEYKDGKKGRCLERSVNYVADFVYKDKAGLVHVEDTKGVRTKDYIIKRKLMLYIHQIRIEEI